jgi:hypothetical protein
MARALYMDNDLRLLQHFASRGFLTRVSQLFAF